jgi:phospholipid/cholesterol/gamma-HCH transport system substrate-binding protein
MAGQTINRLKLGVFVTLGLILFIVAVYYIGNKQNMFGNTITLSVVFRNVNGLQTGNNVRYSGINIGTVANIKIVNDSSVQVDMIIEESAAEHIRKDAIATVSSDGLVGNMMVSIIPTASKLPIVESGDFIQSYSRIGSDDMLNTLSVTNENAALLTADLLKITGGILEKKGTVGTLLYDSSLAKDLKNAIYNLKISSANINEATQKINAAMDNIDDPDGLLSKLTSDTELSAQLDQTMDNLALASKDITKITTQLNLIVNDAKTNNGAVQTLLYDTAFVRDLKQSMENINQGTDRFNENMEALKHNFLTRRYFKKKAKEEKKKD